MKITHITDIAGITRKFKGGGTTFTSQGLIWNPTTDTYIRTGTLEGLPISASAGNANLPIQSQMKRCLLKDDGTVNYYLHPSNYPATKLDGSAADTTTGADGQVMVEIPKFYFQQGLTAAGLYWDHSLSKKSGYTIHPDFIKDGVEVDFAYYSAYEGSMWRASTGQMTAKEDIATSLYQNGDKMCSVAGQWIKTNEMRSDYRAMSAERGLGWRQLTYFIHSATQLLYLIEYADFNSQATIGAGRTELSGGAWAADSYLAKTGLSDIFGNASGSISNGGTAGFLTDTMSDSRSAGRHRAS